MRKVKSPTIHRHHRIPRSRGGGNSESNISMVREKDHQAFHHLFGNMLPDEVAAMLTDTWIDSNFYLVAVPRKRKSGKRRTRMYCTDCEAEVLKHLRVTKKGETP